MRKNGFLYTECNDPISDIQQIRNRAIGAYLSLLDDSSVDDEVLACLDDVVIHAGRVQKWFIKNKTEERF